MLQLRHQTPAAYKAAVLADLDGFLQDHAANERKVSQSALSLAAQHPDRPELVAAMIELAEEELSHFRQVYEVLCERGQSLGVDVPDPYMTKLRGILRKRDVNEYLLDRLILFAIVEARGCERFALVAEALEPGSLKSFYEDLVRSESRHHATYLRLARLYYGDAVSPRLDEMLDWEAQVARALPVHARLH